MGVSSGRDKFHGQVASRGASKKLFSVLYQSRKALLVSVIMI